MKRFSIPSLVLMITLTISACGAQPAPPPTINPAAISGTMAAMAFTMVAETQAAIPTATPIPPTATFTNTPLPTNTFLPLTPQGTSTPAPNSNSGGGDPCINQVMPATLEGKPVRIRVDNSTDVAVSFSIYLQTTPQGKCGYRAYSIEAGQSLVLNDLIEACYTLWAWNPDPKNYFIVTNGTTCINDSFDTWAFDISTRSLKLR